MAKDTAKILVQKRAAMKVLAFRAVPDDEQGRDDADSPIVKAGKYVRQIVRRMDPENKRVERFIGSQNERPGQSCGYTP